MARNDQSCLDCFDAVAVVAGVEAVAGGKSSGDEEMAVSSGARNDQSGSGCLTGVAVESTFLGADAVGVGAGAGDDGVVV